MLMLGLNSEGNESVEEGRALPPFGLGSLNTVGVKGVYRAAWGRPSSGWLMSYVALETCGCPFLHLRCDTVNSQTWHCLI